MSVDVRAYLVRRVGRAGTIVRMRFLGAVRVVVCAVVVCVACEPTGALPDEPRPIPDDRIIDWASVAGIEGGIPSRPACAVLSSVDATGATNVLPALQSAIDACPQDHAVVLPKGRFLLDGSLRMKDRVSLRGAGASTVLLTTETLLVGVGLARTNVDAVSGFERGSTRLTLANAPPSLTVGSSFMLNEKNDPTFVHPYGYEDSKTAPFLCSYCDEPDGGTRVRGQMARVTTISGNTVEFAPALYSGFKAELEPRIYYPEAPDAGSVNMRVYVGLESLTVDPLGKGPVVRFEFAQNCWLDDVRVEIRNASQPSVIGYFAHRIAIRHSTFVGHVANAQAVLSQVHTEGWLVENNIFTKVGLSFMNVGRQGGHVFAYNFLESNWGPTTALLNDNGNHGAHPQFLLYEGNKLVKHHADSIHGSSSHFTLFRNHFLGRREDTTFGAGCIWIDSWNYDYTAVGNVLGYPGMSDWQYEAESPAPIDQRLYVFRFAYSGYNPYGPDPRSKSTLFRHGNFDFGTNAVHWDEHTPEHRLPPSLYLSAKPAWYGSLPWPSIGPDVEGYYTHEIPAEYRFHHGGLDPD